VRAFADTIGTGGLLAAVLQTVVCVAGLSVKEDWRLKSDGFAIPKVVIDKLIENRFLDVTFISFVMEPGLANVFVAAFAIGILHGSKSH